MALRILGVALTIGEKGVALKVGENLSLKLPLCTRLCLTKYFLIPSASTTHCDFFRWTEVRRMRCTRAVHAAWWPLADFRDARRFSLVVQLI